MKRILHALRTDHSKETAAGFLQIIFVLVVVGATMGVTFLLKFTADKGPALSSAPEQVVVDVLKPVPIQYRPSKTLTGQVETRADVTISPEVNGRVTSLHPQLLPGGVIKANETLFSLDRTDYEIALQRSRADVASAQADLVLAQADAENFVKDWQRVYPDQPAPTLVAKEPQIAALEARLAAAEATVSQAEANLARTDVRAKNTIRVIESAIEQDQFVVAGGQYGRFFVEDALRIRVSAGADVIAQLGISPGADVTVQSENAGSPAFKATVSSLGASLDERTRLQPVLISMPAGINLAPGMFVKVTASGRSVENVFRLPATALASRTSVWRVSNDALEAVDLSVVDITNDYVVVDAFDVKDGVVVSQVPTSFVKRPVKIRKTVNSASGTAPKVGSTQ